MRVALVVGSAYEKNAKLTAIPSAEVDIDLVARRLSLPDAGFKVLRFEAERGLAERIEQRLLAQVEPVEELLVYFSGYAVLSEERGPALLLDGDRLGTFSLKRLKALFLHFAPRACLVMDAAAVVDADQQIGVVTEAVGRTLTEEEPGIEAIIGVRSSETPDSLSGSSFTALLLTALDSLARSRDPEDPINLRRWFQATPQTRQHALPSSGWFGSAGAGFAILVAQAAAVAERALPSFEDAAAFDSRPPSSDDLTPAKASLPSFETPPGDLGFSGSDDRTPTRATTLPSFEDSAPLDDGALPRFDDTTNPESSLPRFDDTTSPQTQLPRFDDITTPQTRLPRFEETSSADSALPRFDDTTSPQIAMPRFEDVPSESTALPRFDDAPAVAETLPRFDGSTPSGALPRFDDAPVAAEALPRFEDGSPRSDALPRFDDAPAALPRFDDAPVATTGALPRFDDAPAPAPALPRFDDAPAATSDALPRFDDPSGVTSEALPRFDDAPTASDALPRFEATDVPPPHAAPLDPSMLAPPPAARVDRASRASSRPLPRFEIPDGAASDLDALLGLGQPSEPQEAPTAAPPVPPSLEDAEPATQPGGSPFEPGDGTATTQPTPTISALPSLPPAPAPEEVETDEKHEASVREYEAALALPNAPGERTRLLAELSRALAKLGRTEEAAQRFSEASDLDSSHPDVLCVRAEWAEAALDFENLLNTVQTWLALQPGDPRPLAFFARAAEALGDAPKAVEAWSNLGNTPEVSRKARAEALSEASRIAETKLQDIALAEDLAGQAFGLAPAEPTFRRRAGELLSKTGHPERLLSLYEQALDNVRNFATQAHLLDELEAYAAALGQRQRAAEAFERLSAKHPDDLWLRDRLTELYAAAGSPHEALVHCRAAARLSPTRAGTYRRAQALFQAAGAIDGAWNAASVLECLGEADINEALFASQHKPEGLLAARNMIAEAQWPSGLLSDVRDPELEALLSALDLAAVRAGIALLKQNRRYIEPDPALKEDPDRSTTMLAKTLGWTSRLLGLAPPSLYILPELASNLDVAPSEEPAALVSRALGSGLGLGDLAFLWGRHLTRFRGELRALSFFRGPDELASMLRAALALGGVPEIDPRTLEGDTKRLYAALRREVPGSALEKLQRAARRFPFEEIDQRATSALRGLELAGVRAGLLACGDVGAAAELLQRFPESGITGTDEQLGELYAFSISEPYEGLRLRIGVAVAA